MRNLVRIDQYNQDGYSRGRSGLVVLLWWFVQGSLFRYSIHTMDGWRRWLLLLFGAKVGKGVKIRSTARFTYPWKVAIGDHTWIGDHVEFYSLDMIAVGSHCVISQQSYLCTGSHQMNDPAFGLLTKPIVIRDGAWVASGAFVYPGVTIHEMAVAGARSTVIRDIPANEVHVGSPANFLKYRFQQKEESYGYSEKEKEALVY
ncbi:WcaF family extracellular polysaccharide biosynthesis acetyltransferase [Paenibacillus oenotherae]|uniref:WcaF family extracellular polysaccharide biosynthesis acetyltransferase n=1 Tax=Paenibacillus oenotherae TaxID=1435645 RepID=A0ABS7DA99_9BACL|nr:WcaF family extracellular polysaccharide biosynthesis acetyltransferase [Paenibacillus oenotherae]MBW7476724.1 WcaF family extracellular polysaccharide biosynthesis acetyltransferase [Paenibacillus oenotherae]